VAFDHAAAEAHFATYDTARPIGGDERTWHGPIENCDVCSRPLGSETYMIDGPAQATASLMWGNLCVICAFKHSPTIGWGKAQLYKRQGTQWHLIAGGPPPEDDYDL
jgi:hypothetical protein